MNTKLALVAAIVAICIASPALAQSFDPEAGSGNIVASNAGQTTVQTGQVAVQRSGLYAYAMVPRETAPAASTDPAVNGGGSTGYNEMILKY
jgi:hypothetical protein